MRAHRGEAPVDDAALALLDFIILHYKLTQLDDTAFWRYCAAMPVPEPLQHVMDLFRHGGRVAVRDPEGFLEPSGVSIYLGLGWRPHRIDPFVGAVDEQALRTHFARLRSAIAQTVASMPDHAACIDRHVRAQPPGS